MPWASMVMIQSRADSRIARLNDSDQPDGLLLPLRFFFEFLNGITRSDVGRFRLFITKPGIELRHCPGSILSIFGRKIFLKTANLSSPDLERLRIADVTRL